MIKFANSYTQVILHDKAKVLLIGNIIRAWSSWLPMVLLLHLEAFFV